MHLQTQTNPTSKTMLWTGRVMSALVVLMLVASAIMKFIKPDFFVEEFTKFGWDKGLANGLGILELACIAIYLIPQTSILGAILLTGYLGGAVATHIRIGDPFAGPVVFGVLLWGGLWFRCARLRALLPWKS